MTYGSSDDLRAKALSYYDASRKSKAEVCGIFGVSLRTFAQWVRLRKEGDFRACLIHNWNDYNKKPRL